MNGLELERSIMQNAMTSRLFSGIYSADLLPKPKLVPSFSIVNTDSFTGAGEHWLALYFHNAAPSTVEIFDSLANKCPSKRLLERLKELGYSTILFNNNGNALQSLKSNTCGAHCLFYAYIKCTKNLSLQVFLNEHYTSDRLYNDCMVLYFANKKFKLPAICMERMLRTTKCDKIKNVSN